MHHPLMLLLYHISQRKHSICVCVCVIKNLHLCFCSFSLLLLLFVMNEPMIIYFTLFLVTLYYPDIWSSWNSICSKSFSFFLLVGYISHHLKKKCQHITYLNSYQKYFSYQKKKKKLVTKKKKKKKIQTQSSLNNAVFFLEFKSSENELLLPWFCGCTNACNEFLKFFQTLLNSCISGNARYITQFSNHFYIF